MTSKKDKTFCDKRAHLVTKTSSQLFRLEAAPIGSHSTIA